MVAIALREYKFIFISYSYLNIFFLVTVKSTLDV